MYTTTAYSDLGLLEGFPHHGVFYKLAETVGDDGDYSLEDDDDEDEEESLADDGDYGLEDDDEDTLSTASESADDTDEETATDETDSTDESSDSTDNNDTDDGTTSSDDDSAEEDDEEDSSEIIILETPCDIQQNTALFASATITRGYRVYFPFNPDIADLPSELKPGILFRGECHGLTIAGTVLDPVASELGVCMVEIRGTDI